MGALILLSLGALAAPVYWEEGRRSDVLFVELRAPGAVDTRGFVGVHAGVNALLDGARPVAVSPRLPRFFRIEHPNAEVVASLLADDPRVAAAWLAYAPMPPPSDIPPTTEDFRPLQEWLDDFGGLGLDEGALWPGGTGANVTVADIEYGWDPEHEDLEATIGAGAWGDDTGQYRFHGTSVLGQLVGGDNGYGIVGAVPDAQPLVISPYDADGTYDIAAAIAGATGLLRPGDVLLIEQQSYANGDYCPVSVDPAVRAAIADATAAGIVVVEPGGNGAQDLDDPVWEGAFAEDSGSILVGGGSSPLSGFEPRSWYPFGSSYGSRVNLQGWYDHIVTTTSDDQGSYYADLYYPDGDGRQAYTQSFSGTSGASPMIAAAAAMAQSVAIELTGEPWTPAELRAALIATGSPQVGELHIGPQPDVRRLLRTYFLP